MGPTSSILLRAESESSILHRINNTIDNMAVERTNNDFYLSISDITDKTNLRPFAYDLTSINNQYDQYSEIALKIIEDKFKFYPKYEIGIFAMCNNKIDHELLGEITLKIAQQFDGVICFGGKLDYQKTNEIKGEILEIDYEIANGKLGQYQIANIEFMTNWLLNENFHLIK